MPIASLTDLYVDELADLYDAESQMLKALPRLGEAAHAPALRDVLSRHAEESRLHLERLELIFTRLGERATPRTCRGVGGIVQEMDDRLNQVTTPDLRDAAIIGLAQRLEHYEIAAYGCARTYARRLNRPDEARLLQETLEEEGRADHRLSELGEAYINDDARSEAEMHDRAGRRTRRLKYVASEHIDHRRLADGDLSVRNDADDALGVFDGLVIDAKTRRPKYVVVHARGLFGGRRYLLPVGEVRYDQAARLLRVNLDKEMAERYPSFDSDAFEVMNDDALGGYESSLMEFFRRGDDRWHLPKTDRDPEPDWVMTGVWLTLPPPEAAALPDDARAFANEFASDQTQVFASGGERMSDVAAPADTASGADRHDTTATGHTERRSRAIPVHVGDSEQRDSVSDKAAPDDRAGAPPHGDKLRG